MDFVLDQEIIDDFKEQIAKEEIALSEIISKLKVNTKESSLFEESGQISDRIYGAVTMFNIPDFALYSRKIKEISYKCSQTEEDHEVVRKKCFEFIKQYCDEIKYVKENISNLEKVLAKGREYKVVISRLDRLLASYLHSIKSGSVSFDNDQKFIFVYDKSAMLEYYEKSNPKKLLPEQKFYNADQGFLKAIMEQRESVYGLVIDTSDEQWMNIIQKIRMYDPSVPIVITSKKKRGLEKIDRKKLQVQGVMVVTASFNKVIERFKKVYSLKESKIGKKIEGTSENASVNSEEYQEVATVVFKNGIPSPVNVYLKVGGKYIKLINKSEPFDTSVVKRHVEKGVENYYILKSDFDGYMKALDEEMLRIHTDPEIGFSEKKESFLDYAQDIQCFFEDRNIDAESLEKVREFVGYSEKLIKEVTKENSRLKEFLSDMLHMERYTSICLLAGIFLNHIDAGKSIHDDIGLACYLHDIGLKGESKVIRDGKIEMMNEEEKKIFYAHPKKGAKILAEEGIKPALFEAVAHHHMRYDGSGFPKRDSSTKLNQISEVISMAEEFLDILNICEGTDKDPINLFRKK